MGRLANALWANKPSKELVKSELLPSYDGVLSQTRYLSAATLEAFGINTSTDTVTRAQAMSIPSVRRGRQVIAGTLGAVPLIATRERANQPPERVPRSFLAQPDTTVTRAYTITWTLDDLLFRGRSWWYVEDFDSTNFPARAFRVDPVRITLDYVNEVIRIDGIEIKDPRRIIRFDGPDEGILVHGARTLKTALMLEEAVRKYARMDIPLGFLKDEEGALLEEEITTFLDAWEAARVSRTTGYLPKGMDYKNPSFNAEQLQLGDARAFMAQEVARLMNLPASYVNAPSNDSLNYSTTESNRRELSDIAFAPYQAAIEERLSMPDVTPLGTTVAFDLGKFLRGDLKTVVETGAAAVSAGLMTVDEVRTEWMGLPPMASPTTPKEGS